MPRNIPRSRFPYLFLPDGWDDAWRSARAASTSSPAWIAFLGDSIIQGYYASDFTSKSFMELIRSNLISTRGYPLYADYYSQLGSSPILSGTAGALPWTGIENSMSNTTNKQNGWHTVQLYSGTGAAGNYWQDFTTPYACTALDLLYEDANTGTWSFMVDPGFTGRSLTYNINGAGATAGVSNTAYTVTNAGNGTAANTVIKRIQVSGMASAVHGFRVGWDSNTAVAVILGAAVWGSASTAAGTGIGFVRAGISGAAIGDLTSGSPWPADRFKLWQGTTPQQDASTNTGFGFPTQPHLVIMNFGINDCQQATSIATFQQNIARFIAAFRRGQPNASILYLVPAFPDGNSSDSSSGWSNPLSWYQYVTAIYELAPMFNVGVVNMHAKWGQSGFAAGYYHASNNAHPSDAGHADIANTILPLIT